MHCDDLFVMLQAATGFAYTGFAAVGFAAVRFAATGFAAASPKGVCVVNQANTCHTGCCIWAA